MEFELEKAISVLERSPKVISELLVNLDSDWTDNNEGPDTWSPFDVVGHLVHGEITDWIPRTEIILNDEGPKTFEVFDRFAQFENSQGKSMSDLLDEFALLRQQNIKKLKGFGISDADLEKTGVHPEFGEVTLSQLLAAWVAHDLGHIVQISRVMAKQYKTACGPWPKYLRVLNE